MAGHACAHRNVALAGDLFALRNFSVTIGAGRFGVQVRAVAEIDVRGDLVHPHPVIGLPSLANPASFWMAGLSVLMALWHCMHTEAAAMVIFSPGVGFGWHILHCSFRVAGVLFVAERDRLLGGGPLGPARRPAASASPG